MLLLLVITILIPLTMNDHMVQVRDPARPFDIQTNPLEILSKPRIREVQALERVTTITFNSGNPMTETANFNPASGAPSITITSNPTGASLVKVDGAIYATPHIFEWESGSQHTLEALTPVSNGPNSWYVWSSWSDGGLRVHTFVTPNSAITITATFTTQTVGATWYVDGTLGTNDGGHGSGPGSSAFKTIQYAVNDARVLSGHMIIIASETYPEKVTVNKAGLILQGVGYPKITARASPVILLAADSIIINGFEIYDTIQTTGGYTGNSLVSDSGWGPNPSLSGFTITDCKFHDSDYGVRTQSAVGNVIVRNSEFYRLKRGGVFLSSGNLVPGKGIMTVDAHDNWFHDFWYDTSYTANSKDAASVGIDNGNGWINGNVYSNYISGMKLGLRVYYAGPTSGQIVFSHNTIDQTYQPINSPIPYGTMGFAFWGLGSNANNVIIRDNIIANAGWYGIYQEGAVIQGSFQVVNNLFYNNYRYYWPAYQYPYQWFGNDARAQAGWYDGPANGFTFTNDITGQDPKFAYGQGGPDQQWALTYGSPAYHTASDGTNIGAWQGTTEPPQSLITVTSSPAGSGFVKVDDVAYDTPHDFSWDIGSTHILAATSPIMCGSGCQYVWTSWSDGNTQTHTYTTPGSAQTVTATYKTQYQVTFTHSGVGDDSSGTVVTVNSNAKTQSQLPYTDWYDSGSTIHYDFSAAVSATSGKQYVWTSTSGLGQSDRAGSFQVTDTGIVTGTYWLAAAPISGVDSKTVPAGETTTVGGSTLGVSADVTTTTGTPIVVVATYYSNPGGPPPFTALGKYVDVHVDSADGVMEVMIRVYYTDEDAAAAGVVESSLALYWWNGASWQVCSETGVDTASNFIWARITAMSNPNLSQLVGTPFSGGETPGPTPPRPSYPVGGVLMPANKLGIITPYLALAGLIGAITIAVAIKTRRKA